MRCMQKNRQTSRILWKCLCLSGFQHGRSWLETSLRPPIDLPSDLPCSGMKRNNLVVGHVRMFLVLKAEFLHRCANADLRAMSARHGYSLWMIFSISVLFIVFTTSSSFGLRKQAMMISAMSFCSIYS